MSSLSPLHAANTSFMLPKVPAKLHIQYCQAGWDAHGVATFAAVWAEIIPAFSIGAVNYDSYQG